MKKLLWGVLLFAYILIPQYTFAFTTECTGGTITNSGGKTIHTFTSSGTFDCTGAGSGTVDYLVVAGGGGGGRLGGGGGAGGYQTGTGHSVSNDSYSITVGGGGAGSTNRNSNGTNGSNSVFDSITATGGGGGGSTDNGNSGNGSNGGSGGGGGVPPTETTNSGGTGSQGEDGGTANGLYLGSAGGGGAGENGDSASSATGGNGGDGTANSISGSSVTYAGGGGGGGADTAGTGGSGGGGAGATGSSNGSSGTSNTGGGGGGSRDSGGGNGGGGGSGTVIISYTTPDAPENITGSGTVNRLVKFTATTTISNSLFLDDGSNIILTSGNLFLPTGSLIDTVTNGILGFGTSQSTTMTFGRTGQNMIINSNVGIGTSSPIATLAVSGGFFANMLNILADGLGLDTYSPGILAIGSTTANSILIGHTGVTTTLRGNAQIEAVSTVSNCNTTASPASCGSAPAGSVALATSTDTIVVNTTAITANSQVLITEDSSLGSRLGITCNTGTSRNYSISARTAGTSFTIKSSSNPTTNKACLSYFIVN